MGTMIRATTAKAATTAVMRTQRRPFQFRSRAVVPPLLATTTTQQRRQYYSSVLSQQELPMRQQLQQQRQRQQQRSFSVVVTQTISGGDAVDDSEKQSNAGSSLSAVDVVRINNSSSTNAPPSSEQLLITQSCWDRIRFLLRQKRGKDETYFYLRVFVDAGGCSGFVYQFELDTDEGLDPDDDVVFTHTATSGDDDEGQEELLRVVVDTASLNLLQGSTLDYQQSMIKSAFVIADNPQSESACGCGSSFAVKNFAANPAQD